MTAAETRRPRLNPFAFASDTSLRFVLLVVLVACASGRQWSSLGWDAFDLASRVRACMAGKPMLSSALLFSDEVQHQLASCLSIMRAGILPPVPIGLALLAGATWLIYRAYPRWQVWRLRLERVDPVVVPELSAALDVLCQTAGLRQNPEFWWNPLDRRPLALAFGIGRRRVALTGAIALQLYTDPKTFRVVVLHELAHIRNGDVGLAYLTLSIWWAFLATTMLPYAATTVYVALARAQSQYVSDLVVTAAQFGLFALCVLPARNAVLRARELYADARSFAWHQDAVALAGVLGALTPVPRSRRLLSPHPAPSRRQRLIEDTDEMFRFGAWDAFGVGLCAGFAGDAVLFLVMSLVGYPSEAHGDLVTQGIKAFSGFAVSALILIPMIAGTVAIGTWRAAFLALMRGHGRAPVLSVAAACATGAVMGGLLPVTTATLLTAAGLGPASDLIASLPISPGLLVILSITLIALFALALTLALAAFLAWVEVSARCWLAASLPRTTPGAAFILGLASCLAVATLLMTLLPPFAAGVAYAMYQNGHPGLIAILWYAMAAVKLMPFGPIACFGIIALWAFPLSAVAWSARRTDLSWAFLDAVPSDAAGLPTVPFRLRRAMLIGVSGGIAASFASIWTPLPLTAASLHGLPLSPETAAVAVHNVAQLMTGVAAQGLVAALTVLIIPRLAIPHALCAAFVTGGLFAVGHQLHLLVSSHGRVPFSRIIEVVLPLVLSSGALIALACASIVCLSAATGSRLCRLMHRHRPDRVPHRVSGEAA